MRIEKIIIEKKRLVEEKVRKGVKRLTLDELKLLYGDIRDLVDEAR